MPPVPARKVSLLLCTALASFAASGGNALATTAAAVPATYQDEAGVVHYAFDPATLPGSAVTAQAGKRSLAGGCTFSSEGSAAKADAQGATVTISRELTFDATRCTRELAVAGYRLANAPAVVTQRLEAKADGERVSAARRPGTTAAAASYTYNGYLKVNVEDPPQIDVTSTTARVQWSGASCVSSSNHIASWGWYSPSGWSRTNASWSMDRTCSRAYTNTYGKYRNGVFCATIDTWTEHKKTWFEGRPGGGWSWSYSVDKWGGCTALLHYEYIVVHP